MKSCRHIQCQLSGYDIISGNFACLMCVLFATNVQYSNNCFTMVFVVIEM